MTRPAPPARHPPRGISTGSAEAAGAPAGGTLYVVATPIGNRGDITLRALETLRSVRLVAAEDTRHTRSLLQHFQIATPLVSYHAHNRAARLPQLLAELAQGDVALVSDAGSPVISDPGEELVTAAAAAGHRAVPIPGPSAPIAALSVSGLEAGSFHFAGFLPRRSAERRRRLRQIAPWPGALICFEAPHRLRASLGDMLAVLGNRRIAVCCELTKLYEEVLRGTLESAVAHYAANAPRGEFTLVIEGAGDAPVGGSETIAAAPTARSLVDRLRQLENALGDRRRALAALAAETRISRKSLYAQLVAGRPPTLDDRP